MHARTKKIMSVKTYVRIISFTYTKKAQNTSGYATNEVGRIVVLSETLSRSS